MADGAGSLGERWVGGGRPHRVAVAIVRAAESGILISTMSEWGATIGAAARTLRMWCCASGICARDATRFLRALTAICGAAKDEVDPADLLDFAERRTLTRFLTLSGPLTKGGQVVSVADFCRQQQFIRHRRILRDIQRLVTDGVATRFT